MAQNFCQPQVTHVYNLSYSGGRNQEDHTSKLAQSKYFWRPYLRTPNTNRAGGAAQAIEHLPSKCEALSSSSRTVPHPRKKKEPDAGGSGL
jgi:hypothetical protein